LKTKTKLLILWIPAFIWLAVIFIVGSTEIDYLGGKANFITRVLMQLKAYLFSMHTPFAKFIAKNIDKFYHAFEYLVFTILLYPPLSKSVEKSKVKQILLSAVIVSGVAVADELHQIFVPSRYCSFTDFLADAVGMLIAQAIILSIYYLRRKNGLSGNQGN